MFHIASLCFSVTGEWKQAVSNQLSKADFVWLFTDTVIFHWEIIDKIRWKMAVELLLLMFKQVNM